MIPLHLKLNGIYSYKSAQEIDFTKLTDSALFGIFGATGSGKSTIPEAISFVIYGESERMNNKDNRAYNMFNLSSSSLGIELHLLAGPDNHEYLAVATGKRTKSNFGNCKIDRSFYRKEGEEWIPVAETELHAAIGISYTNFNKTIIIPQGQFQEFLQLTIGQRTAMLNELFSLHRFDLASKANRLEAQNKSERDVTDGRLAELSSVTTQELEQTQAMLQLKTDEKLEVNAKLEAFRRQEQAMALLQLLFLEKLNAESELKTLQLRQPAIEAAEKQLLEYELVQQNFSLPLSATDDSKQRLLKLKEKDLALNTELSKLLAELEADKPAFEKLKQENDTRSDLTALADRYDSAVNFKNTEQNLDQIRERYQKAGPAIKTVETNIASDKAQILKLQTEVKKLRTGIMDESILQELSVWFANNALLKQNALKANEALLSLQNTLARALKQNENVISAVINEAAKEAGINPESPALPNDLNNWLSVKLRETELLLDGLRLKEQLKTFAHSLHEGEPCPLCGSEEHPDILQELPGNDGLSIANAEKNRLKGLEKAVAELRIALAHNESNITQLNTRLAEQQLETTRENAAFAAHNALFVWPDFNAYTAEKVKVRQQENSRSAELANKLDRDIAGLREQAEKNEELLKKFNTARDGFTADIKALQAKAEIYSASMLTADSALFADLTAKECAEKAIKLRERFNSVAEEFRLANEKQEKTRRSADECKGQILSISASVMLEESHYLAALKHFAELLTKFGYENEQEVRRILNDAQDSASVRRQVAEFRTALAKAESKLAELLKKTEGVDYETDKHLKVKQELAECAALLDKVSEEAGALNGKINWLNEQLLLKKDLEAKAEQLRARAADIATLQKMFKAQGFVKYVLKAQLHALCEAANIRFMKLTRQRLSLFLDDDQNIMICDFLHGGKVRSVKTLSGGQTFQAALSLALAMSDSIAAVAGRNQTFFFLDEGFGSQDKESLATVFATLKSLRNEQRVVGIISHVEDLQQEIDTAVYVENLEESGSVITASYDLK
ncbi:MAG: SMC family ATPase [Bacteroidota bacterium]